MIDQNEAIKIIRKVARKLAPKYTFGYYDTEDIVQEACILGLSVLDKYDESRGSFENFMWTHLRNRLASFKRDNYERNISPCDYCETCEFGDKRECDRYVRWCEKMQAKRNIISPMDIDEVCCDSENNMRIYDDDHELIDARNIIKLIDDNVPLELRQIWLRLKGGITLYKNDRNKIMPFIFNLLQEHNISVPDHVLQEYREYIECQ